MDYKMKLASVLKDASKAVLGNEAMASDLATISQALELMPAEKFASASNQDVLKGMFDDAKPVIEGKVPAEVSIPTTEVSSNRSQWDKNASFWSVGASLAVRQKLASTYIKKASEVLDSSRPDAVPAAALKPEEIMDGTHPGLGTVKGMPDSTNAVTPANELPNIAPVIKSDMVDKCNTAVNKDATAFGAPDEPVVPNKKEAEKVPGKNISEPKVPEGETRQVFAGIVLSASPSLSETKPSKSENEELALLFADK